MVMANQEMVMEMSWKKQSQVCGNPEFGFKVFIKPQNNFRGGCIKNYNYGRFVNNSQNK